VPVGVLGLAFKPNTDDVRESPAIELVRHLYDEGATVTAFDPQANLKASRLIPGAVRLVDSPLDCAAGAQALVLMTEWSECLGANWAEISASMRPPRFLFDGRNALDPAAMQTLGFGYQGVGRGIKSPVELISHT
jgi:UDPglucose 6-dehydrogenase